MKKRYLLNLFAAAAVLFSTAFVFGQEAKDWDNLPLLLKNINPPVFSKTVYNITKYGAKGNGKFDCTQAIKKAIETCSKKGGGVVLVPKGKFLTGAIYLKSKVNLHLEKNATLVFTKDKSKYLPVVLTRFEGVECMNYSPFIYALNESDIAITGEGTLDGQGDNNNWWNWAGKKEYGTKEGDPTQKPDRKVLIEMGENNTPVEKRVFGDGHFLRPNFVQPYKCKNILIEGVTFKNSPMWFLNPVLSQNITVKKVTVEGLGPNNDGCDPESSKDILIEDCYFDTGDDCIAIKSGRNNDGRRINVPCENIVIRGCTMKEGHGGVVIGSEISGGVKNVFAYNCTMDSPNLERALRFKTNSIRGGLIENIYFKDVKVGQVSEAVVKVDFYYEEGDKGEFTPIMRNIKVENVTCEKSKYGIWIKAYERSPLQGLELKNCNFKNAAEPNVIECVKDLKLEKVFINGKEISR